MHPAHAYTEPAHLAIRPEDYARFKIARGRYPAPGGWPASRSRPPSEEWWYFDSLLDDGAKLAIIFCTKDGSSSKQPLGAAHREAQADEVRQVQG